MKILITALLFAASIFLTPAAETISSWYGQECSGRLMANGKPFQPDALTCASWDYPLGTRLRVCHKNRSVFVTVTDRGPSKKLCARGRRLDLSRGAFERLAPLESGVINVTIDPL